MPRPRASPENLALALDFACVVTTDRGADALSFVARHGPHSIYAVFAQCCPGVIRDNTAESNRKGVSEAEFLRTLAERAMHVHHREFLRFRDRKAAKMADDHLGAGMCMFLHVRWRDPANPADLKYLRDQHKRLLKKYPVLAETTFESWLAALTSVLATWQSAPAKSGPVSLSRRSSDASLASTLCNSPASPGSPPYDTTPPSPPPPPLPHRRRSRWVRDVQHGRAWLLDDEAPAPPKAVRTPQNPAYMASAVPSASLAFASFALSHCGPAHHCGPADILARPKTDFRAHRGSNTGQTGKNQVGQRAHRGSNTGQPA